MNTTSSINSNSEDHSSLLLFLGAFVLGLGIIVVCKLLHAPALVLTLLVAALVVGYGISVARIPRLQFRLDQAGDNAYYLGLLFTLTSMAWALYAVSQGVSSDTGLESTHSAAEQIIGDFGVALGSTIAGILTRVVLHQMRVDPADVERAARMELSLAAQRMRSELESITSSLGEFHEQVRQRSEDAAVALLEDYRGTSKKICGQLGTLASSFSADLQTAQLDLTGSISAVSQEISALTSAVTVSVRNLCDVEPPPVKLGQQMVKTAAGFGEASVQITSVAEAFVLAGESLNRTNDSLGATVTRLDQLLVRAPEREQEQALRTLQALGSLESAVQALSELGVKHSEVLGSIEAQSARSMNAVLSAQQAATSVLQSLTKMTSNLEQSVGAAIRSETIP